MCRRRSKGSHAVVTRPETRIDPASGNSNRLTSLRMVLLPAPLLPTRATVSPRSMARSTPFRTLRPPRARLTPSNAISVVGCGTGRLSKDIDQTGCCDRHGSTPVAEVEPAVADREAAFPANAKAIRVIREPPLDSHEAVILDPGLYQLAALVEIANVAGAPGNERHEPAMMEGREVQYGRSIDHILSHRFCRCLIRSGLEICAQLDVELRPRHPDTALDRQVRGQIRGDATLKADSRPQLAAGGEEIQRSRPCGRIALELRVDHAQIEPALPQHSAAELYGPGVRRRTGRPGRTRRPVLRLRCCRRRKT